MGVTKILLFGALFPLVLTSPLLPDSSTSRLQLPDISMMTAGHSSVSTYATILNANFKGKCFEQKPPTETQWPSTNMDDCRNAVIKFGAEVVRSHPTKSLSDLMVFSKSTTAGIELPKIVKSGSCAVLIDINTSKDFELMPTRLAMDAAWTLATLCVESKQPGQRIGGSGFLGEKKLVEIKVYGGMPER